MPIPSITDNFIAAFVFENEIHDLFGVEIRNIAIDFKGQFLCRGAAREPIPSSRLLRRPPRQGEESSRR